MSFDGKTGRKDVEKVEILKNKTPEILFTIEYLLALLSPLIVGHCNLTEKSKKIYRSSKFVTLRKTREISIDFALTILI